MTAILESIINADQSGFFELDPTTCMTRRKSDPFDQDMQIDHNTDYDVLYGYVRMLLN